MKKLFFIFITYFACYTGNSQNVSSFTGSFNYNFPLINLPSNRGSGINIEASYNAGIQMNQPASEIGLGWNLNAEGAIYRSVSGIPDDTKFYPYMNLNSTAVATPSLVGQGSLYPEYSYGATTYDISRTRKGLDTSEFTMPDFDNYSIVAPQFSSQLKLSYYKYYPFINITPLSNGEYDFVPNGQNVGISYRKPQFHFFGDFADTLVSRHHPDTINSSTPFNIPTTALTALGYTASTESFIGKHLNGSIVTNQNFDIASGRIATSNFVEYFTNAEINTGTVTGMVDYKTSATRSASIFPVDGIGYFRVTASNGLTYHYSLPVYQLENTIYRCPLNNDYSSTGLVTGDFTSDSIDYFPGSALVGYHITIKSKDRNKYAIKWLLTAITAADYVDANNNRIVDDADNGYWMAYDYQLWHDQFVQRYPKYGYDYQYSPDPATQEYPVYFPLIASSSNAPNKQSGLYGAVTINKSEVYYLNKIRTSSHTAVFIRDVRKDEKSDDEAVVNTSTFTPSPELFLKRVILFKNEQLDSLALPSCSTCTIDPSAHTDFDFTNAAYSAGNLYTENWYNAVSTASYCILKQVVFDQDYSLCKKYHGNVEVRCDNSTVLTPPTVVQSSLTVATNSVSGKLTLKRILTYDFQNEKIIPSTIFDYDQNNLLSAYSNPDYNPLKADYWGYYKSDATAFAYSRYTNTTSMLNTKAWSLLKITDPLGGITEMEYESNSYNKVLDNQSTNGIRGAAFVYRIKKVVGVAGTYTVHMEEANDNANSVNEISYLNASVGCTRRICIPYFENKCYSSSACLNPASTTFFKGLQFGDCDLTLNFTSNIATGTITGLYANPVNRGVYNSSSTPPSSRAYIIGSYANVYPTDSVPFTSTHAITYSGNGFILLETAIGYNVYGGGIRVKKIKNKNSASEVYIKEYAYTDGVATNEMDRFAYPRLKAYENSSTVPVRYGFLEPKSFDRFDMSPYIGYSKVTVKDLGQINTDNGKIESVFITDPNDLRHSLRKNYPISIVTNSNVSYGISTSTLNIETINECQNVFAGIFGATKETKVYDKNNNMLTRSVNEYTTTQQGALTEVFYFDDPFFHNKYPAFLASTAYTSISSRTISIIRNTPVVLKSSTTYGMGSYERTETIARDELTGETIAMQSSGKNNSSSISFKFPGYKHYHTVEGVDFTTGASRKIFPLGHDMYTYGNIDSTITTNSFLNAAYKLYSKTIRQWDYNGSLFAASTATLPYYVNNRSFIFDAGQGSMNDYGLLNRSNLYSNPLNLSTINNDLYWEPGATVYNWKLASEVTLMDENKHLIETRDANNRFTACRYGYNGYYKTASVTNCNYPSFTYAGFETAATHTNTTMDGDLLVNTHTLIPYTTILPHTGSGCIGVTSDAVTFISSTSQSPGATIETGFMPGRTYRASVWTHSTNLSNAAITITVSGIVNVLPTPYGIADTYSATAASNLATTIGNWSLIQIDFAVPENYSSSGGEFKIELISHNGAAVYFDDLILHPVESDFSANVYNARNGRLMSVLDGNGLATNYFYNASGLVTEVWKEIPSVGYKKIKKHTYNYARGAAN